MGEKLQKVMAQAGLGSRRHCEDLIAAGRVKVNGRIAQLGERVNPAQDRIRLDDREIGPPQELLYYLVYKPAGYLSSTRSQGGNPTVIDLLNLKVRVYPVGRLDLESEGLILLTNDGRLTNRLTHPRYEHEKEYLVHLDCWLAESSLDRWRAGLVLPDGTRTAPADVSRAPDLGKHWLRIVLRQGRKRQIRRSARELGCQVKRLIRVRLASLEIGSLQPGDWRSLGDGEVVELLRNAGLKGQEDRRVRQERGA